MMLGDVDAHVGVYYMANATDVSSEIADVAIALLRGEPYPPGDRTSVKVDPQILDRYVGDYEVGDNVFTITREGDKLFVQKNKNKKGEMLAETTTSFFLRGHPATVSFEENPAGVVDRMVIFEHDWQLAVGQKRQ
jgi:hypothetical protein